MRYKLFYVFVALFFIQGCATAPMASAEKDTAAKTFFVNKNKSNLYVYRNENFGAAISMDLAINGKEIGKTAAKTYFKLELEPGKYQVQSKSENVSVLDVILNAGENTFIWQEVKMGVLYARTKLTQVDANTGKKGVLESKLIASTVSDDEIVALNAKKEASADPSMKLKELKKLLDDGLITQQEYDQSKSNLLKAM